MAETPRRPNRAHGTIDRFPEDVRTQILDWLVAHRTYREIADEINEQFRADLAAQGKTSISEAAVRRWACRQRTAVERVKRLNERVDVIGRYLIEDESSVEQSTNGLLQALLMESLVDATPVQVKSIADLAKVAQSHSRIQTAQVSRARLELQRTKGVKEAADLFRRMLQEAISEHPQILEQILDLVGDVETELTAEATQ